VVFFHREGGGAGGRGREEGEVVVEEGVGDETAGVEGFGGACVFFFKFLVGCVGVWVRMGEREEVDSRRKALSQSTAAL
jgi:hypothetical protein